MATDKKHIAVYLDPAVEQALIAFCEQKGLISKKGTMYSAGVNAALAQLFEITDTVTVTEKGNISAKQASNIPDDTSNIPLESIAVEALPGKLESGDSLELLKVDNRVVEQLQNELSNLKAENETLKGDYAKLLESQDVHNVSETVEPTDLKQKSVTARDLPDAYDLLNQLKAKLPKSKATPADVEALLELLDKSY